MTETVYINHVEPYGKVAPYYMAMVDLSYAGLPGQVEQVWLNPLDDRLFRVACIPFCAYGLAYLDEVSLDADGAFVRELVAPSGNRVLRVLVHDVAGVSSDEVCESLRSIAVDVGLGVEMHGDRFIAFDVPKGVTVRPLVDELTARAARGVLNFEWGDLRRFVNS